LNIIIIAAALPPQLDGIGDYTACLAAELARSASVTILTGAPTPDPIPGVRIETVFSADAPASVQGIADYVKANPPDWVLLQYNPFSYGKWGLNLHLPETLRRLRRVSPGTRLAVMVHEPFVPIITPQFAVMATWQRWQLWRLGQAADVLFFSIDPWAKRFSKWFPGKSVHHLPVGSNIPLVPISRQEARERLSISSDVVVLGLFGSMHISRMLGHVRAAAQSVQDAGKNFILLYVGPSKRAIYSALEGIPMIADGPFPSEEISRRFSAMDVHLTPFDDGISTRRGSVMCGLQHGIATVGTRNYNTDKVFWQASGEALLLAATHDEAEYKAQVLRLLEQPELRTDVAQGGQRLYQENFTWERITGSLLTSLEATL
jgi:glycosyltransferase involved in cell wall biosynthesis